VSSGDGIAIVEQGLSFGGGSLQYFGINSNTGANGFLKGFYKKKKPPINPDKSDPSKPQHPQAQ
jgi:hypothetical protein